MAVRLRLRRMGRKKRPFYRIVAADQRSPRDGRFIEVVGFYDPLQNPHQLELKEERIYYWLENGAQPSTTVKSLLRGRGIWYRMEMQKNGLEPEKIEEEMKKWELLQVERQKRQEVAKIEKAKKKAAKKEAEKEEKKTAGAPAPAAAPTEAEKPSTEVSDEAGEASSTEDSGSEAETAVVVEPVKTTAEEKTDEKPDEVKTDTEKAEEPATAAEIEKAESTEPDKKDKTSTVEEEAEKESETAKDEPAEEIKSPEESKTVEAEKPAGKETSSAEPVEEKPEDKKNVKKELGNVSSDEKTDTAENAVEAESKDEK